MGSRGECRLNDFQTYEDARNPVTERIVDREQRESTIRCLENKYRCGKLPRFTAHLVDKLVPPDRDCPCLRECTIVDLIQDYNDHRLGLKNSKQFRLMGGT